MFGPIVGVFEKSSVITNHIPFSLLADVAIIRTAFLPQQLHFHSIYIQLESIYDLGFRFLEPRFQHSTNM